MAILILNRVILLTCTLTSLSMAGQNDRLSHLEKGFGNLDMGVMYDKATVLTELGSVPDWLSGTFIR